MDNKGILDFNNSLEILLEIGGTGQLCSVRKFSRRLVQNTSKGARTNQADDAGLGVSSLSNVNPEEPSPRPGRTRRAIQQYTEPSIQRVRLM